MSRCILFIILCLWASVVGAYTNGFIGAVGLGGQTLVCSPTPAYTFEPTPSTGMPVADSGFRVLIGNQLNAGTVPSLANVCRVDMYTHTTAAVGNITPYNYEMRIYSSSSSGTDGTLSGASGSVSGSSFANSSWVRFDFSTPVNVDANDIIGVTQVGGGTDASNFPLLAVAPVSLTSFEYYMSTLSGYAVVDNTIAFLMRVYVLQ